MPTERLGVGGMSPESRTFYDKQLLLRARGAQVFRKYGRTARVPRNQGANINFRRFESIVGSTTALTEGTPPSETNATFVNVSATLAQYGAYARVSDILELQGIDPVIAEYVANFGEALGESLDLVTRDVLVAGTTVQFASTSTSRGNVGSGMLCSAAELREAVRTLKAANAKPIEDGKYIAFISERTWFDLMADTNIVNAYLYSKERGEANPLTKGAVGDWMGIRFVETQLATRGASLGLSGADVEYTMLMGKDAYGVTELEAEQAKVYVKPRGSGGTSDPLDQISTIGYKAAFAAVRLNEAFMVRIDHVTSSSQAA